MRFSPDMLPTATFTTNFPNTSSHNSRIPSNILLHRRSSSLLYSRYIEPLYHIPTDQYRLSKSPGFPIENPQQLRSGSTRSCVLGNLLRYRHIRYAMRVEILCDPDDGSQRTRPGWPGAQLLTQHFLPWYTGGNKLSMLPMRVSSY
jgi:hypothetical protein